MDATPITLGQEFGGYASQIEHGIDRLRGALPRVCELPLGGTAVGTGINAPKTFARRVIAGLAEDTQLPLVEARNHVAAQSSRDAIVELSGALRTLAVSLMKIANDLRWMASGPNAGLGEIRLPALQPGSSIMPGKVNPVLAEVVTQVAAQVMGNDAAIAIGGSQGSFELNVFMPLIAANVLDSIHLLTSASTQFATNCIAGITADEERLLRYAEASPAVATALAPHIGYEAVAAALAEANRRGCTVREVVLERKLLPADELDRLLDVRAMTRGGVPQRER
jgi:fumarate hydratase class II